MKVLGIISGILLMLTGFFCFSRPIFSFSSLGWLIGIMLLAAALGGIASWWEGRKTKVSTIWDLIAAVLSLVVGVLVLTNLQTRLLTDMAIITLFGVWLIVGGILRIVSAIKVKPDLWGFSLALGIVLILLGIYSLFHPLLSLISLGWCVAFSLLSQGINLIVVSCMLKKNRDAE